MRLDTQDQLTAVARFLDEAFAATNGGPDFASVRASFDAWADHPTDEAWDRLRATLTETTGPQVADQILGDLAPYVGSD